MCTIECKATHGPVLFDEQFKPYLPYAVTAARVVLVAAGVFLAPEAFAVSFALGAAVGYQWPETYNIDPLNIMVGCLQNFWELIASRKQPAVLALAITTAMAVHHMVEAAWMVGIAGYMVGQWCGGEVHRIKLAKSMTS